LRREDDPIKYEMAKVTLKDAMTRKWIVWLNKK
jgi:hypothetical protein